MIESLKDSVLYKCYVIKTDIQYCYYSYRYDHKRLSVQSLMDDITSIVSESFGTYESSYDELDYSEVLALNESVTHRCRIQANQTVLVTRVGEVVSYRLFGMQIGQFHIQGEYKPPCPCCLVTVTDSDLTHQFQLCFLDDSTRVRQLKDALNRIETTEIMGFDAIEIIVNSFALFSSRRDRQILVDFIDQFPDFQKLEAIKAWGQLLQTRFTDEVHRLTDYKVREKIYNVLDFVPLEEKLKVMEQLTQNFLYNLSYDAVGQVYLLLLKSLKDLEIDTASLVDALPDLVDALPDNINIHQISECDRQEMFVAVQTLSDFGDEIHTKFRSLVLKQLFRCIFTSSRLKAPAIRAAFPLLKNVTHLKAKFAIINWHLHKSQKILLDPFIRHWKQSKNCFMRWVNDRYYISVFDKKGTFACKVVDLSTKACWNAPLLSSEPGTPLDEDLAFLTPSEVTRMAVYVSRSRIFKGWPIVNKRLGKYKVHYLVQTTDDSDKIKECESICLSDDQEISSINRLKRLEELHFLAWDIFDSITKTTIRYPLSDIIFYYRKNWSLKGIQKINRLYRKHLKHVSFLEFRDDIGLPNIGLPIRAASANILLSHFSENDMASYLNSCQIKFLSGHRLALIPILKRSFFDPRKIVDQQNWAVSLIDTAQFRSRGKNTPLVSVPLTSTSSALMTVAGHAVIAIESINEEGKYSLMLAHLGKGESGHNGVLYHKKNPRDVVYKGIRNTWLRSEAEVKKMIEEIKKRKKVQKSWYLPLGKFWKWKKVSPETEEISFVGNCMDWDIEMLAFADIHIKQTSKYFSIPFLDIKGPPSIPKDT